MSMRAGHGKRTIPILLCVLLAGLLWTAGPAGAVQESGFEAAADKAAHDTGHEASAEHHGITSSQKKDLVYRIINFTLLVVILVVVLRKTAVTNYFSARRQEIEERFKQLKAERDAAKGRSAELEEKLRAFEAEKASILEQFRREGAKEKEKIIAEARERAEQILAQADMTIEREIQGARDRLKREIVDLAADRAREMIEKNIQESDQDRLVAEFIQKVEKLN